MVFDQTGALANVKRHDYLPFGEELYANAGSRTTTQGYTAAGYNPADKARQKFTGYESDVETGLNFAQARYNSSAQGRFTSADSFGGLRGNPQTLNRYAYVNNSPTNLSDPGGHMPSIHLNPRPGQEDGDEGYTWDDPTSPQAVLQSYTALPARYEAEISDWAHQANARHDQEVAQHQAALADNVNFLLSLGPSDSIAYVDLAETSVAVPQSSGEGEIYVCKRKTQINGIFSVVNSVAYHFWLKTDEKEAGLGAVGGGVPGQNAPPDSPYVTETSINDHTGESKQPGASCEKVRVVDVAIVNRELEIGKHMGRFSATNNCFTLVNKIIWKANGMDKRNPWWDAIQYGTPIP